MNKTARFIATNFANFRRAAFNQHVIAEFGLNEKACRVKHKGCNEFRTGYCFSHPETFTVNSVVERCLVH